MSRLPKIHGRRELDPGKLFRIEQLDLEFSNGERRRYERLKSQGLGTNVPQPRELNKRCCPYLSVLRRRTSGVV